jgi:hypothetical protein
MTSAWPRRPRSSVSASWRLDKALAEGLALLNVGQCVVESSLANAERSRHHLDAAGFQGTTLTPLTLAATTRRRD